MDSCRQNTTLAQSVAILGLRVLFLLLLFSHPAYARRRSFCRSYRSPRVTTASSGHSRSNGHYQIRRGGRFNLKRVKVWVPDSPKPAESGRQPETARVKPSSRREGVARPQTDWTDDEKKAFKSKLRRFNELVYTSKQPDAITDKERAALIPEQVDDLALGVSGSVAYAGTMREEAQRFRDREDGVSIIEIYDPLYKKHLKVYSVKNKGLNQYVVYDEDTGLYGGENTFLSQRGIMARVGYDDTENPLWATEDKYRTFLSEINIFANFNRPDGENIIRPPRFPSESPSDVGNSWHTPYLVSLNDFKEISPGSSSLSRDKLFKFAQEQTAVYIQEKLQRYNDTNRIDAQVLLSPVVSAVEQEWVPENYLSDFSSGGNVQWENWLGVTTSGIKCFFAFEYPSNETGLPSIAGKPIDNLVPGPGEGVSDPGGISDLAGRPAVSPASPGNIPRLDLEKLPKAGINWHWNQVFFRPHGTDQDGVPEFKLTKDITMKELVGAVAPKSGELMLEGLYFKVKAGKITNFTGEDLGASSQKVSEIVKRYIANPLEKK